MANEDKTIRRTVGRNPSQAEGARDGELDEAPGGRTAGSAEGDRDTIEERLRQLEGEKKA